MNKFFLILLITLATATGFNAQAQPSSKGEHPTREQLAEVQAKRIAQELKLDDATAKRFIAHYTQCQKEVWDSAPKVLAPPTKPKGAPTDSEAEQIIKARFEHKNKINAIQEKYYAEYSKYLTQSQILRAYDLEKDMMDSMFRQRMNDERRAPDTKSKKKASRRAGQPPVVAPADI
jgi:hypothetical protein